jgi:hypothetical protein
LVYKTVYWYSKNIWIKKMAWLCNLLFPIRCYFQNCDLVWNIPKQGSTHKPALQFWHLNLIWVNTQNNIALWTFHSYPGLFSVEYIWHYICLPFWGPWSLFRTLNWLVEKVSLPCLVVWGWSTLPPCEKGGL